MTDFFLSFLAIARVPATIISFVRRKARVAVSLRAVAAAAAHSLLSGCGRVTVGSHRITLPRALPHLVDFIHVFLPRNWFSGGWESGVAGEYFLIPPQ